MQTSRRTLLQAGLAAPLATSLGAAAASAGGDMFSAKTLMADVRSYAEAGNKQSGGAGDRWAADWMAARLAAAGFSVERQQFEAPWFQAEKSELVIGDQTLALVAQPLVVETSAAGLNAPLRLAETAGRLDGAIAVIRLPYRRWSTITDRAAREPLADAIQRGASAAILVTTGPTGEALLLNAPADTPAFAAPLGLLAPMKAAAVIEAARNGQMATLTLFGKGGVRVCENIIGRIDRGAGRWLVISTPRSGWTDCAGERGPGIAIWLALAAWMPAAFKKHNLLFVSNGGHEFENLGASHLVADVAPPPAKTDFWFHLGANAATRDWHETPGRLLPLPSADPYRFLMVSADLVDRARVLFKGQPGLEMAYSSADGAAGELAEVVKAGYLRHAGIFGAHRQHHAPSDTIDTISETPLVATAQGVRSLLSAAVPKIR
jgi:hypothetical protein